MRPLVLTTGVLLGIAGFTITPLLGYFAIFYILLPGVVLILLGVALPGRSRIRGGHDAELAERLIAVEYRQAAMEEQLRRIESHLTGAVARPASPPPFVAAPPPSASTIGPPLQASPPSGISRMATEPLEPPPSSSPPGPLPPGMSRIEFELGTRWFQWIGLLVLTIAFVFLLVIVLPSLTREQIVGADFAAALGLVALAEFLFRRERLGDYAKGLVAGAFALTTIGAWAGGFFFVLPGFPWQAILVAALAAHGVAALRYGSPVLATQAGLFAAGWLVWLRASLVLTPYDYAILLSVAGPAALGMEARLRDEATTLVLLFAFDGLALATASFLAPRGWVPVVAMGLATVLVVTALRRGEGFRLSRSDRTALWFIGILVAYGILLANAVFLADRGGLDDLTIFATYATLTAAFTVSEALVGEERTRLAFAGLLGLLSLPIPLLMARGEAALLVYPILLVALATLRPVRGLALYANLVYVGLILFAAVGIPDPREQFALVWGLFFGVMAAHAYLQERSGYAGIPSDVPTDLQVPLYGVALAGLTARWVTGDAALGMYVLALPFALVLNRQTLRGPPWKMAAVIAAAGIAGGAARLWALTPILPAGVPTDEDVTRDALLAAYHVGLFAVLGAIVALRKPMTVLAAARPLPEVRVCLPALALLLGLLPQDAYVAPAFVLLPVLGLALAAYLDDAVTFNAAYVVLAGEVVFALTTTRPVGEAFVLLPLFAAALLALGFGLDLGRLRTSIAGGSQVTGAAFAIVGMPLAFGPSVTTTIGWTAVGAVAIAWGLWRTFPALRYAGFLLVFAVLGKVFLYDIAGLAIAWRVLGLIVVAVALLAVSYGYARVRRGVPAR